jgi:hypothetical protein
VSASNTFWFNQLKALTERRRALLEGYEPRLPWAPWAKDAFERQLTRINDEEAALWGMYDDLEVLVRKSVGAPKLRYHLADGPCRHALLRGFQHVLEGQARGKRLTRCLHCRWPATEDLRVSA